MRTGSPLTRRIYWNARSILGDHRPSGSLVRWQVYNLKKTFERPFRRWDLGVSARSQLAISNGSLITSGMRFQVTLPPPPFTLTEESEDLPVH